MTSKPKTRPDTPDQEQTNKSKPAKSRAKAQRTRRPARVFSSQQKARAVLAAWTEKLSLTEICRQMDINYMTLQNWQNRAMDGMLQALENHLEINDTTVLNPRLRKLMDRGDPQDRLGRRLMKIQQQERDNPPALC
ncbi:transposase [uncultured Thiodictyon sp.]|jgi:transposase-like protein|uniref:transposase n=1 Tax=uncultured Thiodictyon sp. TaxID=1846217 RepID=UPI003457459C